VLYPIAFTCLAVAGLLVAEYRDYRPGVWLAKPLASTGFVALRAAFGPVSSASCWATWPSPAASSRGGWTG
jgi:hypothetical protein